MAALSPLPGLAQQTQQTPLAGISCPPPAPALTPERMATLKRSAANRGLLWRLEKDGRTSWLYGTIHIGRIDWVFPGPAIQTALRGSDLLALELNPLDADTLKALAQPADPAIGQRVLTPQRRQRLASALQQACLPPGALDALRPVMQAVTLAALSGRAQGLYVDFGVDMMLAGFANGLGKPVLALETAAEQLALLVGKTDAEEGAIVDSMLDDLQAPQAASILNRLAQAWASGDAATLAAYPEWCDCLKSDADRALMARMDNRNPPMANKIAEQHAQGRRVFAAVGALHMVGTQALPELLRARGFTVSRVTN